MFSAVMQVISIIGILATAISMAIDSRIKTFRSAATVHFLGLGTCVFLAVTIVAHVISGMWGFLVGDAIMFGSLFYGTKKAKQIAYRRM